MASDPNALSLDELRRENADLRKRLDRAERSSRLVLDSALDYAIVVGDMTGRITDWSAGAHQILGWSRDEMLGKSMHRFFTAEDRDMGVPEREIGLAVSQGRAVDDRWHLRADGERFWASGLMMPMWDEGHLVGVVKVIRDLTDRVEAEQRQQLHAEQLAQQFQQLAESIPQLVWISDVQGRDLYFNPQWEKFSGLSTEQLVNNGWHSLIAEEARQQIVAERAQAMADERDWEATFQMQTVGEGPHWCLCRALPIRNLEGEVIRWFSSCTDIDAIQSRSTRFEQDAVALRSVNVSQEVALDRTRQDLSDERHTREAAEDQVRQLQKMEAVGQLTGGIAHDFNNMLTVIMGSLNMLQARLRRGDTQVDRYADLALEGTTRAAELTHRLLAFSRQQVLSPEPVDLNRLVTGLSGMLQRTLGSAYQVEFVRHAGLWLTQADIGSLEQVILNLCVNARDAMETGGRITVETGNVYIDDDYASQHHIEPGEYVLVAVTDTGTGIDAATLERVFEPYFTTKEVGRGTGLGLSQVYGFVKQSLGHIKLYSELAHGTAVKIYLPRYRGDAKPVERFDASTDVIPIAKEGELILVVEDDPRVRVISVESLLELGYQVLDADSGAMALKLLTQHPEISLVFTDVVMPEMTGRQLADQIGLSQPSMRVLYTTGYTRNAVVHHGRLDPGVALLPKPFTLRDLAIKVRQVLDS
ncbi:PAS domain S-box protein (plasmid) [Pseudomonas oryzihabitans]|uniref:PAS domain S-box protein n=1 Tax=Pseudomonas oryzihabitans TaxID=47885 RepID=UPI003B21DEBA